MKQSETIGAIAEAMRSIQEKLPAVGKDSEGYGYKYASLPEVTKKVYPLASEAGISISQILDESVSGGPAMTTLLMHTSGEWISGTYPLLEAGMKGVNSAQQFGAAITYARRYGLLAVLGIPVDDDDAACLNEKSPRDQKQENSRDKVFKLIEQAGDFNTVEMLCAHHKETAKKEGWLDEMTTLFHLRKGEFSE